MVFACVVVMNIVLVFSSTEVKPVMIDLTAVLTSGAALFISGTAIMFAYLGKHKLESYLWLFTGLMFWFSAEVIWAYTRQVLGIEIPYPSIADGAWIIGYGFFAFYTYRILGKMGKTDPIDKNLVLLVSVAVSLSLAYILNLTFGVAEILSATQDSSLYYGKLRLSSLGWYTVGSFYGNSLEFPEGRSIRKSVEDDVSLFCITNYR